MTTLNWLRDRTPAVVKPTLGAVHRVLDDHLTGDSRFIQREYSRIFGRLPDLEHPRTFNEKLQWRKLYDRRPLYRLVSDKVAVRDFIAARVGPECLVPALGVFDRAEDVPWSELPAPYVAKASHGCRWNLFVFDSAECDPSELTRTLRGWLKTDFYRHSREWAYKGMPRRVIVERFLGSDRQAPEDYKFFCFDGVPQVVFELTGRLNRPSQTWYDAGWSALPFRGRRAPAPAGPPPSALPEMLAVAGKLSEGFDFVRVDLYCVAGRVYCGELTIYPCGGFEPFTPPEADEWLGSLWNLPTPRNAVPD